MTIYRIRKIGALYVVEVRSSIIGAGIIWTPVRRFRKRTVAKQFVEKENGILELG
jgi:hypothetical protein